MKENNIYSIIEEINSRRKNSHTLVEWKESFEWAAFWLNNFINTTNNLESMFIKEVGKERYEKILQEWVEQKKEAFYDVFNTTPPDSSPKKHKTPRNDYIDSNIIRFPFGSE